MKKLIMAAMFLSSALQCLAQTPAPPSPASLEEASLRQLLSVRRVYVDRLTGGETAAQMRDIFIAALQKARLFVVTEDQERADATIRGAAEDLVFTDSYSSSDSINARANAGSTKSTASSRGQYAGIGFGENESDRSTERRHEAIASVRLVNKDGDVIWAATEESLGAKFKGASADVAEKITSRLKEDFEKAKSLR
jgi:hypothetical protein